MHLSCWPGDGHRRTGHPRLRRPAPAHGAGTGAGGLRRRWRQGCWSWTIPFSALDLDTEAKIVTGLRQLFGPSQPYAQQCTVVLFSHRLLAFPQADRVVVLDRGRILEQGTHAELSTGNGLYARIYRAQRLASTG